MTVSVAILERHEVFTVFGMRLWDPATDRQIEDGLEVIAWPATRPNARVRAVRGRSGAYSFAHLPGLREIEYRLEPLDPASPPLVQEFIVAVTDLRDRFSPIAFSVDLPLPYAGAYLSGAPHSPADAAPRGVHLFSAPARPLPPGFTAVRGQLLREGDRLPAQNALVRVTTEDGALWFGLSDADGRFAVVMPYPVLPHGFGGSPPAAGSAPLHETLWHVDISVDYAPGQHVPLPGTDRPDLISILIQDPVDLFDTPPGPGDLPVASLPVTLGFGRTTTIRTTAISELLIASGSTSP